ncbi:hypothetical protein AVEN_58294-1, partial [Araneus ventricosus]
MCFQIDHGLGVSAPHLQKRNYRRYRPDKRLLVSSSMNKDSYSSADWNEVKQTTLNSTATLLRPDQGIRNKRRGKLSTKVVPLQNILPYVSNLWSSTC